MADQSTHEPAPQDRSKPRSRLRSRRPRSKAVEVIVALGGFGGLAALIAALAGLFGHGGQAASQQTSTATTTQPGVVIAAPSSSTPGSTSAPTTSTAARVTVRCGVPARLRPGDTITLVYTIDAPAPVTVGLGAGLYDAKKGDHSTGDGDVDAWQLAVGHTTKPRLFDIPADLPPGRYELVAEVWPPNQVGAEGVDVVAEDTCGFVTVP